MHNVCRSWPTCYKHWVGERNPNVSQWTFNSPVSVGHMDILGEDDLGTACSLLLRYFMIGTIAPITKETLPGHSQQMGKKPILGGGGQLEWHILKHILQCLHPQKSSKY